MRFFFKTRPVFFFLLPVFFVLHGFTEQYDFIPVNDALLLVLVYIGSSLIIAVIFWFLYHNLTKACFVTFLIMGYHFFFGSIQDTLKYYFPGAFIARYGFILPASFIFFVTVIILLKRRRKPLLQFTAYLNFLLVLLLIFDAGTLINKIITAQRRASDKLPIENFTRCDTCQKPDIFLIILDEYAGNTELKELFNFDNAAFESQLSNRGFHITRESASNYNFTPFSVASILNMDYLKLNMKTKGEGNVNYSYQAIRDSRVVKFLEMQGYRFYNYSIFDFPGQPAEGYETFVPHSTKLITPQTFISRLEKDINFNIATGKFKFEPGLKKFTYGNLRNNENITRQTLAVASVRNSAPKFIYAHLMMPHYPYYFDSKGNALPMESLVEGSQYNKNNYIEYLKYCNGKILQLVDKLLITDSNPPVIMLLGDHGFRDFEKKVARRYYFLNLNAILLPGKNYNLFYDSMTNVNHFRAFFNTRFNQHIPLLKDSTIYLWD